MCDRVEICNFGGHEILLKKIYKSKSDWLQNILKCAGSPMNAVFYKEHY